MEVKIEVWDTRKEVEDTLSNNLTVNGLGHASGPVLKNHQTVTYISGFLFQQYRTEIPKPYYLIFSFGKSEQDLAPSLKNPA